MVARACHHPTHQIELTGSLPACSFSVLFSLEAPLLALGLAHGSYSRNIG